MLKLLSCTMFFCSLLLCGCAQEMTANLTAGTAETDGSSGARNEDSRHLDVNDDSNPQFTDTPSDGEFSQDEPPLEQGTLDDNEEANQEATDLAGSGEADEENEETAPVTPEEYVAAINKKLTLRDVSGAIALTEEAYAKFPDDEAILQGLTMLLYQSVRIEPDDAAVNQRRMRLGELARVWIARNKDAVESLGNIPILLLEEAKGYLANHDIEKALSSAQQAQDLEFTLTIAILFDDPDFEELIANEMAKNEIKKWISAEVGNLIAETTTFPFDFNLTSFAGDQIALSDLKGKGKILIVDFWGTWCPPCRKEIPHFVDLAERRRDNVAVVGINIEDPTGVEVEFEEAKARFDAFVETQPINYPCVAGNLDTIEQIPDFEGYPTTLFLDETGRVRLRLTGFHPLEMLEAALDHLLKEQAPAS